MWNRIFSLLAWCGLGLSVALWVASYAQVVYYPPRPWFMIELHSGALRYWNYQHQMLRGAIGRPAQPPFVFERPSGKGKAPPPPTPEWRSRLEVRGYRGLDTFWWPRHMNVMGLLWVLVPLWQPALLFAALLFIQRLLLRLVWRRRRRAGLCERCAYDLRGSGGQCPECGWLGGKAHPERSASGERPAGRAD